MNTICIMCPLGCPLDINEVDGDIVVKGNTCKRGERYGKDEYVEPKRSITTLVRLEGGGIASVKTSDAVPKDRIFDVIKAIGKLTASDDINVGDVVKSNILDLGVDVVVTGKK